MTYILIVKKSYTGHAQVGLLTEGLGLGLGLAWLGFAGVYFVPDSSADSNLCSVSQ